MPTTSHSATSPRPCTDDEPSDEALLVALRRGDPGAGGAFVRRFQPSVHGLARSIVGDPRHAEDIAQQALSRAWRQAQAYESRRGSVSTWVLRMTRNLAVETLRRHADEPVDPPAVIFLDQSGRGPVPDESASIPDQANRVRTALRQIPVEERRALVLATFHGYTARDISDAEAIPLGTAKARMRSGLIKVRALLRQDETVRREAKSRAMEADGSPLHPYT